jgi:hypothetical protein
MSRFKLDLDVDPAPSTADPDAGPVARTYPAYEAEIAARGGLDFDDLVARALRLLERDAATLAALAERAARTCWSTRRRTSTGPAPMALLLAAPANRIFLVGDDDQSIYGWRLADVRGSSASPMTRCRSCAGRPRGELPLPGAGARPGGPARRAQRAALREGHPGGAERRGSVVLAPTAADDVDRPPRSSALGPRTADAGGPRADEPRSAPGRRAASARPALPGEGPGAADRVAACR